MPLSHRRWKAARKAFVTDKTWLSNTFGLDKYSTIARNGWSKQSNSQNVLVIGGDNPLLQISFFDGARELIGTGDKVNVSKTLILLSIDSLIALLFLLLPRIK